MEHVARSALIVLISLAGAVVTTTTVHAQADAKRGAQAYKACAACHSLEPDRHLTGPSLGKLFGRKAGSASRFQRYSDALKRSDVVWDENTLDSWLKEPDKFIPGNDMAFPGIKDDKVRRDLIAYLGAVESMGMKPPMGPRMANLKKPKPDSIVTSMRHCSDTYFISTADGSLYKVWEFNLRLKTDTSENGPVPGKPVILGVGMRGDRTAIVFSSLTELAAFAKEQCG